MTKKISKTAELSYVLGVVLIALAVALMSKAGFGVSSIVAPAYIIYLKISPIIGWYTFGMSEYLLQGVLLIIMCLIIRRFKWQYLLSFLTSVIYGFVLDGWRLIFGTDVCTVLHLQIIYFICGLICTDIAVAFIFRSYVPQQIYELFVSEIVKRYDLKLAVVKWGFDIAMLMVAIVIELIFGGPELLFKGVGIGTIISAVVNSFLIKFFGSLYDKVSDFTPLFPKFKEIIEK